MQFLVKDILNNKNLHQTFVRTIFWGSPVGTRTTCIIQIKAQNILPVLVIRFLFLMCFDVCLRYFYEHLTVLMNHHLILSDTGHMYCTLPSSDFSLNFLCSDLR